MTMATARAQRLLSQCETAAAGPAPKKKPVNVVVTGAAGNIAYSIVFHIGAGLMLGDDQPINLILLDMSGAVLARSVRTSLMLPWSCPSAPEWRRRWRASLWSCAIAHSRY